MQSFISKKYLPVVLHCLVVSDFWLVFLEGVSKITYCKCLFANYNFMESALNKALNHYFFKDTVLQTN